MEDLKALIREVPDYPKPGILFYDITTLLKDPHGLKQTVERFHNLFADEAIDKVVGIESRGFLFGPSLALDLEAGFVPVRKPGKLPAPTRTKSYSLEYGEDTIEIHEDAISPGDRVLVVDDLIATGGTAAAAAELVEEMGGELVACGFVVELLFLGGREKLGARRVESLITY